MKKIKISYIRKFSYFVAISIFLFSIFYLLFSATQSFAANEEVIKAAQEAAKLKLSCSTNPDAYPWCKTGQTPGGFVSTFYQIALGLVGGAALGVLIFGAILYTVSAGNASRQKDARDWITGAVWGLVLLLAAYLILYTINPDLVKIGQTQEFLDKLIKPVEIQQKLSSTVEGITALADDSKTRTYLLDNEIYVNKGQCQYVGQTDCTSLANLPQSAVDGLLEIKQECANCTVVVTGGTEAGHKEHGAEQPIVDIRLKPSEGYLDTQLLGYIRDKIGLQSGIFSAQKMEYNQRYTAKDGSFTVIREKNEDGTEEHFHIVFK